MSAKAERLVNLTIALLESRRPLTFAEVRRRTGYYDQADRESARRMFERDKDDLRALGVPIEVREVAFGDEPGYDIDRSRYELPDIDLEPGEVAALALALEVSGARDVALALAKVAARAPDPIDLGVAPTARVDLAAGPVSVVASAVLERRCVRFRYRTADGRTSERMLDPYTVVRRRRAWYVVGRDHGRDDLRAFRLDRVVGHLEVEGPPAAFPPPGPVDVAALVSGPEFGPVSVVVAVAPAGRWSVAARGARDTGARDGERTIMRIDGIDPVRDRAWLLGLAPDVRVVEPVSLAEELRAALRSVADQHRTVTQSGGAR